MWLKNWWKYERLIQVLDKIDNKLYHLKLNLIKEEKKSNFYIMISERALVDVIVRTLKTCQDRQRYQCVWEWTEIRVAFSLELILDMLFNICVRHLKIDKLRQKKVYLNHSEWQHTEVSPFVVVNKSCCLPKSPLNAWVCVRKREKQVKERQK